MLSLWPGKDLPPAAGVQVVARPAFEPRELATPLRHLEEARLRNPTRLKLRGNQCTERSRKLAGRVSDG